MQPISRETCLEIVVASYYTASMNADGQAAEILRSLGLNNLEAEVYAFLLRQDEPMTAYRVGKELGRPTANVYKAIDALARKGAAVVDQGDTRLCRPAPPAEFLGQYERSLLEKTRQAGGVLTQLGPASADEGIYHLHSAPLVLERCRAMLERCQQIAVVDAFPAALGAVLSAVEAAIQRGVQVYLQTYERVSIRGARVALAYQSDRILAHWTSQQLNVVADGQEVLLALLHADLSDVYQAVWTSSLYLACSVHVGLMREHVFHRIAALRDRKDFPADICRLIDEQPFFHAATVPGQRKLFARFAGVSKKP